MRGRSRRYLEDALFSIRRAPAEVGLAVLLAGAFSYTNEITGEAWRAFAEFTAAITIAFAAAWIATLRHALGLWSARVRWTVSLAGALIAALCLGVLFDFDRAARLWQAFLLGLCAVLLVMAAPALGPATFDPDLAIRRINGRVLLRLIGALLYAAALFAGLALALRAIDSLFELHMKGEIYGHVFGWLMFALVPWITVGGLPDYIRPLDETSAVARTVHWLTRFLVPPLLAVYYLILYAYTVRIIALGELPRNLVSPMVIAAGLLAAGSVLLFDPDRNANGPLRALRFAAPLFLPLAVLGFIALSPRIEAYGWTEFRLIRLVAIGTLTLLAAVAAVQLARRRPAFPLRGLLLLPAIALLLLAIGPFSAAAIAKRSQQHELQAALIEAGIRQPNGSFVMVTGRRVDARLYDRLSNTTRYLERHFGREALEDLLPESARSELALSNLAAHFGLISSGPTAIDRFAAARLAPGLAVPLPDGSIAYRVELGSWPARPPGALTDTSSLAFVMEGDSLRVAVAPILLHLPPRARGPGTMPPGVVALPVVDHRGAARGTLLVLELNSRQDSTGVRLDRLEGILLVRPRRP